VGPAGRRDPRRTDAGGGDTPSKSGFQGKWDRARPIVPGDQTFQQGSGTVSNGRAVDHLQPAWASNGQLSIECGDSRGRRVRQKQPAIGFSACAACWKKALAEGHLVNHRDGEGEIDGAARSNTEETGRREARVHTSDTPGLSPLLRGARRSFGLNYPPYKLGR